VLCHFLNQNTTKETPIRTGFSSFIFSAILLAYSAKDSSALGISHSKDALQNQLLEVVFFQNCRTGR
jgi:hypothetical protein